MLKSELVFDRLPDDLGAGVAVTIGQLAGIGPGEGDHLLDGLERLLHIRTQELAERADTRHRREVGHGIIGRILEQRGHRRVRGVASDQERVAVGLCAGHRASAKRGSGAGLVLDHERLPKRLLQVIGEQPSGHVGDGAGADRHDQRHRPRRPFVLRGRTGHARQHDERGQRHGQDTPDPHLGSPSPFASCSGGRASRSLA